MKVLPSEEPLVEDGSIIDHDSVEAVRLLRVDPVQRSTLPFRRGVSGLMYSCPTPYRVRDSGTDEL